MVPSNDDSLRPAEVAWGAPQRHRVDEAWRPRKSGRQVRPVSPWAVHRMHAQGALRGLALVLERVIAQACGAPWRNIRAAVARITRAQWLSPHGEVWQVTEPSPAASHHLQCLAIKNPPALVHLP